MKELYIKLDKAISELPKMVKDTKGYNYKYFDINQILEVTQPIFKKNKLRLLQPLSHIGEKPAIRTIIVDVETGESIEDIFPFLDNSDPQKQGSVITYNRRYSLQSFLGLEAEDDDGNKAKPKEPVKKENFDQNHPRWKANVELLKSGNLTIAQLETKYILSDEIKEELNG